ncbi:hypothetical protein ACU686_23740 [Yinghuangia aomiensis]
MRPMVLLGRGLWAVGRAARDGARWAGDRFWRVLRLLGRAFVWPVVAVYRAVLAPVGRAAKAAASGHPGLRPGPGPPVPPRRRHPESVGTGGRRRLRRAFTQVGAPIRRVRASFAETRRKVRESLAEARASVRRSLTEARASVRRTVDEVRRPFRRGGK